MLAAAVGYEGGAPWPTQPQGSRPFDHCGGPSVAQTLGSQACSSCGLTSALVGNDKGMSQCMTLTVFPHTTRSDFILFSPQQKTLVDVTLENSDIKDQIRNLQQTYEASMDKLREKQRQLEVAQVENKLLRMKVKYRSRAVLLTFLFFHFPLSPPIFTSSISFSLFLVGFSHPLVANSIGLYLKALRRFLCSRLLVQIGGAP